MKVALIVEWLDGWRGGAETSTQQFIHELADLGVRLEVITRSHIASRPGVAVQTIRAGGPSRALQSLRFSRLADQAASRCGADVIHAISPSLAANVYQPRGGTYAETILRNRALRRTRAGRMLKHLAQHVNLKQRLLLKLERRMLARPDPPVVLALSDYVARQLRDHYGVPAERIRKVFNGVQADDADAATRAQHRHEVRELYAVRADDVLALCVAHNFHLKGVRTLIDAAAVLRSSRRQGALKILVVGKARTAPWVGLVRRRGVDDLVQFVGPTQRIQQFYHAADFLAHPTFYDPCSRVVLEALASGIPAITTRYDGAAEMVSEGQTGFVLDAPEDAATLADRMGRMLDDATRTRMRAAVGIQPAADMRRHAAEVLAVYHNLRKGLAR